MKKILSLLFSTVLLISSMAVTADPTQRRQAKRIFDRLTGTAPSDLILDQMETRIGTDASGKTAASLALQDPAFYNITLKNFAAPWTNEEQTVFTPLNDYSATVIGMIRDDVDFREVLYGNILYTGNNSITPYSNSNNEHYQALEDLGPDLGDLSNVTILTAQTQSNVTNIDPAATAGVITTRAAARAFFYLGTNRAMFRFTLINHMCTDLEPLKDNSRSPDRVHQDVSRSPGGDSKIYLNSCVACHAGMDGLGGAYAYYNLSFTADSNDEVIENTALMTYDHGTVQEKYLINENNFKPGYVTQDDSWVNYWRNGRNAALGWGNYTGTSFDSKGNAKGNGLKSMGMELANSQAFAQCQVKKAFQAVCLHDPDDYAVDRAEVDNIVIDFQTGGYQMKQVFRDVAAYCKGN